MASKDLHNSIEVTSSVAPVAVEIDTDGTGVDVSGAESVEIVFHVGIEGVTLSTTDKITLELEESDTLGSGYTDVAAADMIGEESAGVVKTIDAGAEAPGLYRVGYLGTKKYVRPVFNFGGTHTAAPTPISALVIASHLRTAP